MDDTTPRLRAVAELGQYFALPDADGDRWLPITSLLNDATTVRDYANLTRSAIASSMGVTEADVPLKAAASSVHLSIAARLLSPAIGAATCLDAVPLLEPDSLFWQRDSSHRPALGAARLEWIAVTDVRQSATVITNSLIDGVLRPLNETMRTATALSPHILWGNVASAANGAVTVLAQSRPADERRGRTLIASLLATNPLTDAAEWVGGRFRRRNCCLFYQVPGGGYCGDCVLIDS